MLLQQLMSALSELRGDLAGSPLVVLGVLAAIGFAAVMTAGGSRVAAVALLGLAVLWPVVNARLEGPTLIAFSWNHGLSAADLVSVAALLVALWRLASVQVKHADRA